MKALQILNRITLVAIVIIYENRIVSLPGAHTANKAAGVAERAAGIGAAIPVIVQGVARVVSGAAFAVGDMLTADSAGKAVKVDPALIEAGSVVEVLGTALELAGGADVEVTVMVNPFCITGVKDDNIKDDILTIAAGETITANQIVDTEGKHTVNKGIGVALNGGASAVSIAVQFKGVCTVKSGAAFAIGDKLTADSAGKAVKYDPTNVNMGTVIDIIGTALELAGGADESVDVLLCPCVGVGTKAIG